MGSCFAIGAHNNDDKSGAADPPEGTASVGAKHGTSEVNATPSRPSNAQSPDLTTAPRCQAARGHFRREKCPCQHPPPRGIPRLNIAAATLPLCIHLRVMFADVISIVRVCVRALCHGTQSQKHVCLQRKWASSSTWRWALSCSMPYLLTALLGRPSTASRRTL